MKRVALVAQRRRQRLHGQVQERRCHQDRQGQGGRRGRRQAHGQRRRHHGRRRARGRKAPRLLEGLPPRDRARRLDGPKSATDPSFIGRETLYRTFFICCDPLKVLGHWEWGARSAGKDLDALVLEKFPKPCG
jgi:hypothetical protein